MKLPEFMFRPFSIREAYIFGVMSQGLDKHPLKCRCRACQFRCLVEENMTFFLHEAEVKK